MVTYLHIAATKNNPDVFNFLISQHQIDLNITDTNGKTPLHVAIESQVPNNFAIKLIELGRNINRQDEGRTTSLMWK